MLNLLIYNTIWTNIVHKVFKIPTPYGLHMILQIGTLSNEFRI